MPPPAMMTFSGVGMGEKLGFDKDKRFVLCDEEAFKTVLMQARQIEQM